MQELLALLVALLGGITVAVTLARLDIRLGRSGTKALAEYLGRGKEEGEREEGISREGVILAALGLPPRAELLTALKVGAGGLAGLGALAFGMPLVVALGAGALVYILASSWLEGKWRKFRLEIEKELPTFISRLGGTLLVTQSPLKAMEEVIETLEQKSALRLWMEKLLAEIRSRGWQAVARMQEEAALISPSLALVVFQLHRLFETGGTGFVNAFATTADELSAILEARAVASSKAEGARGAVRMMLGILAVILAMLFSTEQIRRGFADPEVQLVTLLAFGFMAFGYTFLNGMIDEALEA